MANTQPTHWEEPTQPIYLNKATLHVWRLLLPFPATDTQAQLTSVLSENELSRAQRFHFAKDKACSIAARAGLRLILAHYLTSSPKALEFDYAYYGKPYLKDQSLQFNLSHSKNCIMYAFCQAERIGIDVEYAKKELDVNGIARRYFTQEEHAYLQKHAPDEQQQVFFQLWTRKEAIIKAIGQGLACPLNQFSVLHDRLSVKIDDYHRQEQTCELTLKNIDSECDYPAAVAHCPSFNTIRYFNANLYLLNCLQS